MSSEYDQINNDLNTIGSKLKPEQLDVCIEAFMSELMRWDNRRSHNPEKPYIVCRIGAPKDFTYSQAYATEKESNEAYERMSHRSAAMKFLVAYHRVVGESEDSPP